MYHAKSIRFKTLVATAAFTLCGLPALAPPATAAEESKPPAVGDSAADFELVSLDGTSVKLSRLAERGPVVLLVLRGYPGYQCPICNRQVGSYLAEAEKLREAGATVLMIYPGPAEGLQAHAEEFITGETLPENFHLLLDPDYAFTDAYRIRWDAPRETAYPSTFVIDRDRSIRFAHVSRTYRDRPAAEEVLKALP